MQYVKIVRKFENLIGNTELSNALETKEHWFSTLEPVQKTLINLVLGLDELTQHKVIGYIQGLIN